VSVEHPRGQPREARETVVAEGNELPVEQEAGGKGGEFGHALRHVPAAAAADAEAADGRDDRAEAVELDLKRVARPSGSAPGRDASDRVAARSSARHHKASMPTRRASVGWRVHRLDAKAAARDQPRRQRV
jgi:hypothetical protein